MLDEGGGCSHYSNGALDKTAEVAVTTTTPPGRTRSEALDRRRHLTHPSDLAEFTDLFHRGSWNELVPRLDAALGIGSQERDASWWRLLHLRGLVCAVQGRREACIAVVETLDSWGRTCDRPDIIACAAHVRALLSLSLGHPELALVWVRSRIHDLPHDYRDYAVADVLEAAVRSGAQVKDLTGQLSSHRATGYLRLRREFALALADGAEQRFERYRTLLSCPELDSWPFEAARIQLAYGEHLLRERSIRDARAHIVRAGEIFHALGARSWWRHCDAELRAGELGIVRYPRDELCPLTAQEREVAELAVSGLTNTQIGLELCLSPRTVAARLYHVFPKLGISSRAALQDALSLLDQLAS